MERLGDGWVEFTDAELLVKEIHSNLMEMGYDQGTAMIMIRASHVPPGLHEPTQALDKVLADEHFVLWLTR
jgi:hypothetical protein